MIEAAHPLDAGETRPAPSCQSDSGRLASCPGIDHPRDLDDRNLATLDGARLQDRDPSRRRRRWPSGRWRTNEGHGGREATLGEPALSRPVAMAECV